MKRTQTGIFATRNLAMMAALTAMQIILARFLSIQATDMLRISFESIPIILAGLWLGPVSGALVALISDFLGMMLFGNGAYFPPIVLGPLMVAVLCGLSSRYFIKGNPADDRNIWKLVVTVVVASIINNFIIGPITTTFYSIIMMGNTNAFDVLLWSNLLGRFATKPIIIVIDTLLVFAINRTVYKPVISRLVSRA